MLVFQSGLPASAVGLQTLRRDSVLQGDNGGVRFMFDLAFPFSWAGGAPVDAAVVTDMAEVGNGDVDLIAGQSPTFAGRGFNFAPLTDEPCVVRAPSTALAGIQSLQQFMVVSWMRLPTSGDWNTISAIAPIFCSTDSASGYTTPEPDLLTIAQTNQPALSARRQTNGGTTIDTLVITALTNFYDRVTQIAYWRNAEGTGLRMRSALGTQMVTGAAGVANTGNFSAKRAQWGIPGSFNALAANAAHAAAANSRLYRGWIEDLAVSGRNPLTVLDADWAATTRRAAFS